MNFTHRVYDDRTGETLFAACSPFECAKWIDEHVTENHESFEHVWIEPIKGRGINVRTSG